jgi:hypothetical protein
MPPDTPDDVRELGHRFLVHDPTIHQDVDICQKVQAGHATGVAPTGRSFTEPEFLLTHFHERIVQMVNR